MNINRESFINLVNQLYLQKDVNDSVINFILEEIFIVDDAKDIIDWREKYQSSSYWMQSIHFSLLSKYYNLRFNFYYLPPDGNIDLFHPELGNESIYLGSIIADSITIHLAHVSTQLRNEKSLLIHFEGILIEPTEEQIIDEISKNASEEIDNIIEITNNIVSFGKA